MEYIILQHNSHFNLIEAVNMSISQGWRPIGGVGIGARMYYQAMTKEKTAKKK